MAEFYAYRIITGKTTFAKNIIDANANISLLSQDNYYKTIKPNINVMDYKHIRNIKKKLYLS